MTVRLSFFTAKGVPPQFTIDVIKRSIEQSWSGLKYKCYDFKVEVVVKGVADRGAVADDELDVELSDDIEIPYTRTEWTFRDDRPTSDDPGARTGPVRGGPRGGTTWSTGGADGEWAHEFGHVIGLDDGYDLTLPRDATGRRQPLKGHTVDLMADSRKPPSAQMITRLIRRWGQDAGIRCPMTFDAGPSSMSWILLTLSEMKVHAWTCDWEPPSDDPASQPQTIKFTAEISFKVGYLPGPGFADARTLFGALTHTDLEPLGNELPGAGTVTFELQPFLRSEDLRIVLSPGAMLRAPYFWDARAGLPVLTAPMSLNQLSTAGAFPGPPLEGVFKHGAKECPP